MANLTIKNNTYEPIALRQQQAKVGYEGAKIVDQSGVYAQAGEAFKKVNAMVIAKEESDEAERVLLASSEVTKRLSDLKINIESNMQGSNAKNAKALYEQKAQAIMDEVYAGSGIKYKTGENMFRHSAINAVVKGSHWAGQWENNQVTEARKVTYGLALDENINNVIAGSMSPEEAYEFSKIQGKHLFANLAPEQMALIDKARADKFANTLVTAAIERNDYESAQAVFDYLKKDMTSESRAKLDAAIYTNQEYSENKSLATALADSGITDPEGMRVFLADKAGVSNANLAFNPGVSFKGAQDVTVTGTQALVGILSQMGIGDIVITSINDSLELHAGSGGKRTHAGGYKIDIASDALAAMTPKQRYAVKAQIERALPGVVVLNEYDEPSANSTGRHFDIDFTDYKGSKGIGMSEMRMDKIISQASSIRADRERQQKAQADAAFSSTVDTLYNMYKSGVSYEDALGQIKTMVGANYKLGKNFETAAKFFWGDDAKTVGPGGSAKKASTTTVTRVNDMLSDGKFSNREEYLAFAQAQGLNPDQIYEANKTYDKYEKGEGIFAYDWNNDIKRQIVGDIENNAAKEAAWIGALPLLKERVQLETQKTGTVPPVFEVVSWGREYIAKKPVGTMEARGTFLNSTELVELSQADYRRSGIDSVVHIQNADGTGQDLYEVHLTNGTVQVMNAAKLYTITR